MKRSLRLQLMAVALLLGVLVSPAPSAGERPQVSAVELAEAIHEEINRTRREHGLSLLQWDPSLAEIAGEHSQDMAEHDYVGHINSAGEDPSERGRRAGYLCRKRFGAYVEEGLAENLCRNSLYHATRYLVFGEREVEVEERLWNTPKQIVDSTVRSWMESREHRENILYPHHEREGIGVVIDEEGRVYVTQLFC